MSVIKEDGRNGTAFRKVLGSAMGFTRLELLATVVSLAALLTLLTGAVPREQARTAVCLANLKELARGMALYAEDSRGYFPGNIDDASSGRNWAAGNAAYGGSDFTNAAILNDPTKSLLSRYLTRLPQVYRCPANRLSLRLPRSDVPQARNYSLNGAVGTNPYRPVPAAVDGPWLDGFHGHTLGKTWQTYGRPTEIVAPSPSQLFTFLDEEPYSVNDGSFSVTMRSPEWIDWPATHHEFGGIFAFADSHVDYHRWRDPSTRILDETVRRRPVPNSRDYLWLQEHTTARIQR